MHTEKTPEQLYQKNLEKYQSACEELHKLHNDLKNPKSVLRWRYLNKLAYALNIWLVKYE